MCKECPEKTWSTKEPNELPIEALTFLENDSIEMWKEICGQTTTVDERATYIAQLAEWMMNPRKCISIHPLICQFVDSYEKILMSEKKYELYEHYCLIALLSK